MGTQIQYDDIMEEIIQSVIKEYYSSMNKIPKEKWEIPLYSKSKIDKAGKTIANKSSLPEERKTALNVLNNWRSAHAYPLQVIASNLRRKNPGAIVVQRLKRLDSITGKLERFPEMKLSRMQDLGGCRVIVDSIDEVYYAMNQYKNSKIRHELVRENDYIQNPKKSGYRSYHMVYKFHSPTKDTYNKNMLIEIQFRTKLQHIWATAVEIMGIYTKSQLKASIGDKDILRFFVLVSSVFALQECTPVCPDTSSDYDLLVKEIREIDSRLNLVSMLSAMSVAIKHTNETMQGKGYYVLQLNYKNRMLRVHGFKSSEIELAATAYNRIEALNNPNIDAVLVSASSFDTLKAAYPNYFTDITQFVDMMRKIIE